MNVRRAVYRLWLVVSGFWVVGVLLIGSLDGELTRGPALVLAIAVLPPLLLLIIVVAIGWVIAGLFGPESRL